jgi:MOSC domain-containing protein YiiM|tara:strand:+ start:113 stop:580 length:468 start_codon:yes stop_codon:yes gene_type:complete
MGKVFKIGISKNKNNHRELGSCLFPVINVYEIKVIHGKGIVGDRYFLENNEKRKQVTLIEKENIDFYNKISQTNIPVIKFRRNIITEGIRLNDLLNKKFFVGKIKLRAHDLCRPCKPLQESLNQKNLVKNFLTKGGLRCEILSNGKISIGDIIKE